MLKGAAYARRAAFLLERQTPCRKRRREEGGENREKWGRRQGKKKRRRKERDSCEEEKLGACNLRAHHTSQLGRLGRRRREKKKRDRERERRTFSAARVEAPGTFFCGSGFAKRARAKFAEYCECVSHLGLPDAFLPRGTSFQKRNVSQSPFIPFYIHLLFPRGNKLPNGNVKHLNNAK